MLEIFDKQRRLIGVLQNAYVLNEERKINAVWSFAFSLPYNDAKNELCRPYHYIRYDKGEFYRILPSQVNWNETGDIEYRCEHVLAILIDNIMFGEHIVGGLGYYTRQAIEYALNHQIERHWVLDRCDFNRQFEYAWTSETLLNAMFSVTAPFTDKYMWTFDTSVYPYKLSLIRLDEGVNPQMYIRPKKNMIKITKTSDPTSVCTRLYPLGEGEGVNQLNIRKVNGGLPYIQSPQEYIDKYGIIERTWIDRRYTNIESLKDASIAMLNELQEPFEEYQVEFNVIGEDYYDVPEIGKVVEIVGFKKTYITGINYNYDELTSSTITLANKPKEIASTIADMMDRQRIEMTYSQGATQFYQDHVYENCDPGMGAVLKLMIPSSMKIVNAIKLDVDIGRFRKPFTVTGGGGAQTISQSNTSSSGASTITTTASGGGQTSGASSSITTGSGGQTTSGASSRSTTQDGGGVYTSTEGGGGESITSDEQVMFSGYSQDSTTTDGEHVHSIYQGTKIGIVNNSLEVVDYIEWGKGGRHYHNLYRHGHIILLGTHAHQINVRAHYHNMDHTHVMYTHTHGMAHTHYISPHTHDVQHYHSILHNHVIGNHVHELEPGISYGGNPSSFDLLINGVKVKTIIGKNLQIDITDFLLNENRTITRDIYHKIEVVPNDPAYVMLTVNVQGFIQSRGDKTV